MGIHAISQVAQVSQVVTLYHPSRQIAKTAYNSPLDPFKVWGQDDLGHFKGGISKNSNVSEVQKTLVKEFSIYKFLFKYIDCVYMSLYI